MFCLHQFDQSHKMRYCGVLLFHLSWTHGLFFLDSAETAFAITIAIQPTKNALTKNEKQVSTEQRWLGKRIKVRSAEGVI